MIRFVKASDMAALRRLWALCFSDTAEEQEWYFSTLFRLEEVWADFVNGEPVAMIQVIPARLLVENREVFAAYLYGVCTHPAYRRQGRMRKLLEEVHNRQEQAGVAYVFLKPENPEVYRPFGYHTTGYLHRWKQAYPYAKADICDCPTDRELDAVLKRSMAGFSHGNLRDWEKVRKGGSHIRLLYRKGIPVAYAVYDGLLVEEYIGDDVESEAMLLGSIACGQQLTVQSPALSGTEYAMVRAVGDHPHLLGKGNFGLLFD